LKEPFYILPIEQASLLKGLFLQGAITKGAAHFSPLGQKYSDLIEQAARESGFKALPEFVSLEELCSLTKSSPIDICKIVSYGQRRGIVLPSTFKAEQTRYSIVHFRKAREKWMGDNT